MKKILFLLLFTIASYGQAVFDEGIQIKNNTTDNSATKVNVQSTDGTINTISKSDLVNVVEVNDVPSLPLIGKVGKIYVVKNVNKIYRWNGTLYQELAVTDITYQSVIDALGYTPENVANKANDFTTVNNTLYPSVQAVKGQLDLKSDKSNFINIKDLGGIGDGVFDNTTIVNDALLTYKEVYFPDGNYLVTSLVNNLGAKITGSGVIVKSIAGGTQQLNTGIDRYNYIFGQEYLSHVQNAKLSEFFVPIKVIWSGDSTTDGVGVTAEYTISSIFSRMCEVSGVSTVQSINAGHSGATTEQWRTLYLPADLAANPDLYIIRWGINDPGWLKNGTTPPLDSGDTYPNRRDISDFETSLRTALSTIRASKTQAQMSIILMSPNPTSDTPNGRDEKWYEQVRKVYAQAARDYKCAFIDTYGLWLDSRGAAGVYMDDPFADGRAIHPLGVFNLNIVEKVFDLTFNKALLTKISDSHLYNKSSVDILPLFSANPSTYNEGLTINRVVGGHGWGLDGSAFTIYNRDNVGGQFNFSRLTANPEINFRAINFDDESIPLSFSNSVRLWHSSNLPFSNNGAVISTTLKLGGYYDTPLDTDTPDEIFTKLPDGTNYTCYSVDTGTGVTGTPLLVTSRFLSTYGVQTASFVSGTGTGKTLTRTRDGGVWSAWKTLSFLESPALTGTPTAPTAAAGTNTTQLATTAFVLANVRPYKVYTALLSQIGNAAPTATVLENTLGGTVVWSRTGTGVYTATLNGAFPLGKTTVMPFFGTINGGVNLSQTISGVRIDNNSVGIRTSAGGTLTDVLLLDATIEIRVYN